MGKPLNIGLVGIGGWGINHLRVLRTLHDSGICRLAAIADPFAGRQPDLVNGLRSSGIAIHSDFKSLLQQDDIEAVLICTPINLHESQTIEALQAGKHVYLEKPPTATLEQWRRMAAAQQASGKVCVVGFQLQTSPNILLLKRFLDEGIIGDVERVWAGVRWTRGTGYYDRASWAGRWQLDGEPVRDGPATNALAHAVHCLLYLAGATAGGGSGLARVRASMRRARPIESYDSIYAEAETGTGKRVQFALIHATGMTETAVLHCSGSKGTASLDWTGHLTVSPHGAEPLNYDFPFDTGTAAILDFINAVQSGSKPATPLQDTLAFMQLMEAAAASSNGAHSFAPSLVHQRSHPEGDSLDFFEVDGLDDQIAGFRENPAHVPAIFDIEASPWQSIDK